MLKAYAVALVMTTANPVADNAEQGVQQQTKAKATSGISAKKQQPKLDYIKIGSIKI